MGSPVVIERLKGDDDVAVVGQRHSSLNYGRAADISAEALKLLALMRFTGDSGIQ